jgi:hypothetical protein
MKFLSWMWQLPQNLVGFFIVKIRKATKQIINDKEVYFCKLFNSAVSLGDYIIIDNIYLSYPKYYLENTVKHESGHRKQSKILGWFYLLFVGLPSIIRNIYDRFAHKKWTYTKRSNWYYGGFPENWADKLGKVKR